MSVLSLSDQYLACCARCDVRKVKMLSGVLGAGIHRPVCAPCRLVKMFAVSERMLLDPQVSTNIAN